MHPTNTITHTPTPWTVVDNSDNGHISRGVIGQVRIDSPSDGTVAICWHSSTDPKYFDETFVANAAHIVRCVNEREELLEALKECHRYFLNRPGNEEVQLANICGRTLARAREEE